MIKKLDIKQTQLVVSFLILFVTCFAAAHSALVDDSNESQTNDSAAYLCSSSSRISSTLMVGVLSSLVFSFIGILPAFFIRTDKDEEMFSKYFSF